MWNAESQRCDIEPRTKIMSRRQFMFGGAVFLAGSEFRLKGLPGLAVQADVRQLGLEFCSSLKVDYLNRA